METIPAMYRHNILTYKREIIAAYVSCLSVLAKITVSAHKEEQILDNTGKGGECDEYP